MRLAWHHRPLRTAVRPAWHDRPRTPQITHRSQLPSKLDTTVPKWQHWGAWSESADHALAGDARLALYVPRVYQIPVQYYSASTSMAMQTGITSKHDCCGFHSPVFLPSSFFIFEKKRALN